jgi:hypothetical protein
MRRLASEIIKELEMRIARLERQSSVDESFLDDVVDLGEYPEIDDIDNIVEAVEEMMENHRVTTADLDKALDDLYNLQGRSLERKSERTLERTLDILEG